jgi:hypothetical protein
MKKIVINKCHGGFGLSPKGLKRWAELNGQECYFFKNSFSSEKYTPLSLEEATQERVFWTAFNIPNPEEVLPDQSNWHEMTDEEKTKSNEEYEKYSLCARNIKRDDPNLIKVVKELKKEANGFAADLKVVSIPDDVDWTIEEYDGAEWVSEVHRTWS